MNNIEKFYKIEQTIYDDKSSEDEVIEATKELILLTKEDYPPALNLTGYILAKRREYLSAYNYFYRSMNTGNEEGAYQVATYLVKGMGVEINQKKAFEIMFELNQNKDANDIVIFDLGLYHLNGYGTEKNEDLAFTYFEKAGKNGYGPAQNSLGMCYFHGTGVAKDINTALYWFYQATTKGYIPAYSTVGFLIENFENFGKNKVLAIDFYVSGARLGDENSIKYIINNNIDINKYPVEININLNFK